MAAHFAEVEKLEKVQHAVEFMQEHDVSPAVQAQVLSWTRFYHDHTAQNLRKKVRGLALGMRACGGRKRLLLLNACSTVCQKAVQTSSGLLGLAPLAQ